MMSTPRDKLVDKRAEHIEKRQFELSDMLRLVLVSQMQESAESYIVTGKFKPMQSTITTYLQAVWNRALYYGITDAEEETNTNKYAIDYAKEDKKSFGFNTHSFSNLVEFARKKDPQVARIDGRIKDLNKYLLEAQERFDAKETLSIQRSIIAAQAQRALVTGNQEEAERLGNILLGNQQVSPQNKKAKTTARLSSNVRQTNPALEATERAKEGLRELTLREEITKARNDNQRGLGFLTGTDGGKRVSVFDPRSPITLSNDPLGDLLDISSSKSARLQATNQQQMFATLNERYPALGGNSLFAKTYLEKRNGTVARTLEQQYQDEIKKTIANYVASEGKGQRDADYVTRRIGKTYQSNKQQQHRAFANELAGIADKANVTPQQYKSYVESQIAKFAEGKSLDAETKKKLAVWRSQLSNLEPSARTAEKQRDSLQNKLDVITSDLKNPGLSAKKRKENLMEQRSLQNQVKVANSDYRKLAGPVDTLKDNIDGVLGGGRYRELLDKVNEKIEDGVNDRIYRDPRVELNLSDKQRAKLIQLAKYGDLDKETAKRLKEDPSSFTYREIRRFLGDVRKEGGVFDEVLNQIVARTASTETAAAYSLGRLQLFIDRGVKYVQWISTRDARTSVFCQSLHRKIFAIKDVVGMSMSTQTFPYTELPEWHPKNTSIKNSMGINVWNSPAHPYAYLPGTRVASVNPELLMRKRYVGKIVTIKTQHGNTLSVTVEHPILTTDGFVRAGDLKGTEYIFDTFLGDRTVISHPDYESLVPRIEDFFELNRVTKRLFRGVMPIPTKNLDSDISNNKVNVVGTTRNLLENIFETKGSKNFFSSSFQVANVGLTAKPINSIAKTIDLCPLTVTPSLISRSYHLPTLFGTLPCVEDFLGSGTITGRLTRFSQDSFNQSFIHLDNFSNFFQSKSRHIRLDNNLREIVRPIPSVAFTNLEKMEVKVSQISDITFEDFEGFVYHVQDASGINVANGIIAHNCRSFFVPIYTEDELAQGATAKNKRVADMAEGKFPLLKGMESDEQLLGPHTLDGFLKQRPKLLERLNLLEPKERESYLQEIVNSQQRMRQTRLSRLGGVMDNLQDMFNSGLSFLTRKIRKDGIADFTVDEVKRNDSQLVTALLGGAAVVGTGAMMYFFMKSNLAATLTEYLKANVGTGIATIGALSQEKIKSLLQNMVTTSKAASKLPDSIKQLMPSPLDINDISLGEKVTANVNQGELVLQLYATGNGADAQKLVAGGVTGVTQKAYFSNLQRTALNSAAARRRELMESANSILSQAFVNKGGAIDPREITSITKFANTYNIGRVGKGNTFVSKKGFDSVMNDTWAKSELARIQQQLNSIDDGLGQMINDLPEDDLITRAALRNEAYQYRNAKSIVNAISSNIVDRFEEINQGKKLEGLIDKMDNPQVRELVDRSITQQTEMKQLSDTLIKQFETSLPSKTLMQGFIPETINSIEELKQVQKIVKQSLAEVRKDFVRKNQSYTIQTAASKRGLSDEFIRIAGDLENTSTQINTLGFQHNSGFSDLNNHFRDRINSRITDVIDLDKRISARLNELS